MDQATKETTTTKKPKLVKFLITFSVLLNVMFIGIFGGMVYKKYAEHEERRQARQTLSPEARHLVARTMQQKHREIRKIMTEAKVSQNELVKILKAEKFDEAAFDVQMAKLKEAHEQAAGLKVEATRALAKELSAEERAKLAKRLSSFFDKRRKHKGYDSKKFRSFEAPAPESLKNETPSGDDGEEVSSENKD